MKVYKWLETEHHHIVVLRPDELFDVSTLEWPEPEDREVRVRGTNIVSGDRETYAMAHNKMGPPLRGLKSMYERANENYTELDKSQLELLHQASKSDTLAGGVT